MDGKKHRAARTRKRVDAFIDEDERRAPETSNAANLTLATQVVLLLNLNKQMNFLSKFINKSFNVVN